MKTTLIAVCLTAALCLAQPSSAGPERYAESDSAPAEITRSRGKIYLNYDVDQVERDGKTVWRYKYREYDDKISEREAGKINAGIESLSGLDFDDIDSHIDSTFSALSPAQKASLKKLYKAVLGLIKVR